MSILSNLEIGVKQDTNRTLFIYGDSGVGKSTFATAAGGSIVLDPSGGTDRLDVARVAEPDGGWTWAHLLEACNEIAQTPHDFTRLVIDELGVWEGLCHEHLCRAHGKNFIEDWGWQAGYKLAVREWGELLRVLSPARAHMEIVFIGHVKTKTYKNPNGPDWDRMVPSLHDYLAAKLRSWCDTVLFARFLDTTAKKENGRSIGITGARVIETTHSATWDAKNRDSLPPTLPLSWDAYQAAIDLGAPGTSQEMVEEITALIPGLPDDKAKSVKGWLTKYKNDPAKLSKILNEVKSITPIIIGAQDDEH